MMLQTISLHMYSSLGIFLQAIVQLCVLSPSGLGARHMSLKQKLHSHWHSVRLVNFNARDMRNWLASVLAHTSDLGTEVGFGDTRHDPEQLLASSFSPVSYSSGVANFSDERSDGDHEVADYDVMTCGVCVGLVLSRDLLTLCV